MIERNPREEAYDASGSESSEDTGFDLHVDDGPAAELVDQAAQYPTRDALEAEPLAAASGAGFARPGLGALESVGNRLGRVRHRVHEALRLVVCSRSRPFFRPTEIQRAVVALVLARTRPSVRLYIQFE